MSLCVGRTPDESVVRLEVCDEDLLRETPELRPSDGKLVQGSTWPVLEEGVEGSQADELCVAASGWTADLFQAAAAMRVLT
jgi:hypothetical protein